MKIISLQVTNYRMLISASEPRFLLYWCIYLSPINPEVGPFVNTLRIEKVNTLIIPLYYGQIKIPDWQDFRSNAQKLQMYEW